MVGNIKDLDPSSAALDADSVRELPEIDRYAVSILQGLIKRVDRAYETFSFYEVYHSVYRFCVIDMSSFYLDILKDRLYTFGSASPERRASQKVIYNILVSLAGMIAPVLSFTAEELWSHIPGRTGESVFLSSFPEARDEFIDLELEKRWKALSDIRDEVNKALEIRRQEKFIGNALEAKVTVFADDSAYELLHPYLSFLPTLFIVSEAELGRLADAPASAYRGEENAPVAVSVEKAEGGKCLRCWIRDRSVGTFDDHPEICAKCHQVMTA